jgi:hypothetical protein
MDILSLHVALVSSNTIKACNELATFKYSFIASEKGAKPHYDHHYHIGQMLANLHLYKTTLKRLNVITQISPCRQRCVHLSSLAAFTVLETLTIDQISLTPHESTCSVFQAQGNLPQNQLEVNLRVSPSLWTLTLHGCNDETITRSLGGVVRSIGLLDLLPGLRTLNIIYAEPFRSISLLPLGSVKEH